MRIPLGRIVFLVIPVAVLGLDFLTYPILFEGRQVRRSIGAVSLLTHGQLELGTFRAHRIRVSMGDIRDQNYLASLNSGTSALLISVYVNTDGEVVRGALADAVLEELSKVAPRSAAEVVDALGKKNSIHPGDILPFDLHADNSAGELPLQYLVIIPLRFSKPDQTKEELKLAFPSVFTFANRREVSALVVPCLGTNWQNKNSITFDEFFSAFFESLPVNRIPPDIQISFHSEWPSFYIEAGVSSLNSNWDRSFDKVYDSFPKIYRRQLRFILLFWCLCLVILPHSTPRTLKNFCIIGVAFVTTALGAGQGIALLTEGRPPASALILEICVLASLAVWLRPILTWTAKEVFRDERHAK